jgi:hypothetical protein
MIDGAILQVGDHGESFDMPEMLRVKASILARSGDLAAAESHLQKCLALARKQNALGWELRGAVSLGHLWRDTGRAEDARSVIEPLLVRYQDGLDTRDLASARVFLSS